MTIQEKENEIIDEFEVFEDWMDKYNYLIELGQSLPIIDDKYRNDSYLISGCQSRVWISAEMEAGKMILRADSDAVITKGVVYLLVNVLSGEKPADILNCNLEFLNKIGLQEHLSPTRANGLTSMIKQIKLYALAFKAKGN
ncbi:MAG: SufE family protein [Bacteroidales bacterium]|jgi:cysteine desulfuration protein SufE|nr:SufE family protein [Bacteroidales bacterium]